MELRHLRYFCAVASHGSFNRAATTLNLTQPALSRQVKDLEAELGVSLFVRGANAVTLTEAGEMFYEEASEILARAEQAIAHVRANERAAKLRIGYGPSLTAGILPQAIERFQSSTPHVRLELEDLSPREMTGKAAQGLLDLVIVPADAENQIKGFSWTELRRLALVLVISARHPLGKLARIPLARLNGLPLHGLGRTNYPGYVSRMHALTKPYGVRLNFVGLINDGVTTLLSAVEANQTAAILTEGVASVLPPTMVMRPFRPALPSISVVAGLPALTPSVHATKFVQFLRDALAAGSREPNRR